MYELGAIRAALRCHGIRDAADYAEVLIAEALHGQRLTNHVTRGHDVVAEPYGRVEVKCRQLPADGRVEERVAVSASKKSGFDFLAIVIFYIDFTVKSEVIVPYKAVWDLVHRQQYNRISYSQARELPGAGDMTQAVCSAAES